MDNLQNGIAAFKAGMRDEARRYFIAAMRENPQNENTWTWLYQVSKNDNERIQALTKVLEINHNNHKAKELLDKLHLSQISPSHVIQPIAQPMATTHSSVPKKNNKLLNYSIAVFISICVICLVAVAAINSEPASLSLSPAQEVESIIADSLGESNRNIQRLSSVNWSEGDKTLTIQWTINDNLTEDLLKRGAMMDIKDVLETIATKGIPYDYQAIVFRGTFSMRDVYGNSSEDQVLLISYQRSTIAKIIWDNFLTDDIYKVADTVWLHPAFR